MADLGPQKLMTHITGLDNITHGGLPQGRTTLVSGTAGSAKTVFAAHFLAAPIVEEGQAGVFVTFEEEPEEIRTNLASFGWNVARWEREGLWRFVDASPETEDSLVIGDFDFRALGERIRAAVSAVGARRVACDSIGAVFSEFQDAGAVRRELRYLAKLLRSLGVTAVLTAERSSEFGDIARHGVEEFVADNVIILRNVLEGESVRRTIQVLKLRGTTHRMGQFPFTIDSATGLNVLPLTGIERSQRSSSERISSGSARLDEMCAGGFFRDSVTMISGPTGTGKTLTVTSFLGAVARTGETALLSAFEESREQLLRNASGWGIDFAALEAAGQLHISCQYPEEQSLEEHLVSIKTQLDRVKPARYALDSLSALERVSTERGYRQFIIGLTAWLKEQSITGLYTSTTPSLLGGESITTGHISTLTDSIVILRYVEVFGTVKRSIAVLKMRGSPHDKEIRELSIDEHGMHIGEPFRTIGGILAGVPMAPTTREYDRLAELIDGDSGQP